MCLLISKPAGAAMPTYNMLKQAYAANPHGCGFATPTKAFKSLNFGEFMHRLAQVDDSEPCIIHFRLATHGSIKKANCHPFRQGNVWFAHNGILDIEPMGDKTDSETAFIKYIYPAIRQYGLDADETYDVIDCIIGYSRFAILDGSELRIYGDYTQYKGCYYSNMRFLSFRSPIFADCCFN